MFPCIAFCIPCIAVVTGLLKLLTIQDICLHSAFLAMLIQKLDHLLAFCSSMWVNDCQLLLLAQLHSGKKVRNEKTTAPRIPMWSPTMVLTRRYFDLLRRSDGMRCFQSPMAVDGGSSQTTHHIPSLSYNWLESATSLDIQRSQQV